MGLGTWVWIVLTGGVFYASAAFLRLAPSTSPLHRALTQAMCGTFRVGKWLIRLCTGKCELERIHDMSAGSEYSSVDVSTCVALEACMWDSKVLRSVHSDMEEATPSSTEDILRRILEAKGLENRALPGNSLYRHLQRTVDLVAQRNALVAKLKARTVAYDSDNAQHESQLQRLWDLLMPGIELSERHTSEWGKVGFQGKDPATDFRGYGVLGLEHLVEFCSTYTDKARAINADCNEEKNWFSFAITGIHVTADVVQWLEKRKLSNYFASAEYDEKSVNKLYAYLFVRFNKFWRAKNPPNVMSYGPIHAEFLGDIEREDDVGLLVENVTNFT